MEVLDNQLQRCLASAEQSHKLFFMTWSSCLDSFFFTSAM